MTKVLIMNICDLDDGLCVFCCIKYFAEYSVQFIVLTVSECTEVEIE